MKGSAFAVLALLAALIAAGCTHTASPYSLGAENQVALRGSAAPGTKVQVLVTRSGGAATPGTCRAAGPVSLPGAQTYEVYLQGAFNTELKVAGILDDASSNRVTVELKSIDYSSMLGNGSWTFTAKVSDSQGNSSDVNTTYKYDPEFLASQACQQVAQVFTPAAQMFVGDVLKSAAFVGAVKR
jgi:hypothetical protein